MFGHFKRNPATAPPAQEYVRACNVYCQLDKDWVIIAAVYNHGGLMAERKDSAVAVKFSDAAKLHEAVRAALEGCEYEETFYYSDQKKSDWPAYQLSGYKTIKRFEAEFIRLSLQGVNEKNWFYKITTPEFGELGLHLTVTVNAHSGNYGEAIQYIVKNYLGCQAVASS